MNSSPKIAPLSVHKRHRRGRGTAWTGRHTSGGFLV